MNPAQRRDVVRDGVALIVASFDDPDLAVEFASGLAAPRGDETLVEYAARLSSTAACVANAAANFARQWARAANLDERFVIEHYAEKVSADLAARDLADGPTQPEGNEQ